VSRYSGRRKITSKEGLRCRYEWPTTTKIIVVDEAFFKKVDDLKH